MRKTALLVLVLLLCNHLFSQGFSRPFDMGFYMPSGIDLKDGNVYTSGINSTVGGVTVYKFDPNGDTTSLLHLDAWGTTSTDIKILPDTSLLVFVQYEDPWPDYGKILLVKLELDGTFIDSLELTAITDNNNQFTPIVDEGFVYFMMLDTLPTDVQYIVKMDLDLNIIYKQPAPENQVHLTHRSLEIAPNNDLYIFTEVDSGFGHMRIHHFDNNANLLQTSFYNGIPGIPCTEGTQYIFNDSVAHFYRIMPITMDDSYRHEFNLNTGVVTTVNTHEYYFHNLIPVSTNRFLCTVSHQALYPSNGYTYLAIIDSNYNILRYNVLSPFNQYINYIAYKEGLIALVYTQSQFVNEQHVALFDTLLNPILGNIHGEVYNDLNNSCDDVSATDIPMNNSLISAQSSVYQNYAFPIGGEYNMYLLEDVYDVSSSTPNGFDDNCTNLYNINVNPGDTFHLDFFKDQREHDLSVDMMSNGFIAALHSGSIMLSVENPGFYNVTGYTLKLVNDTLVDYASATPAPDAISGDTLIWNMLNINPGTSDIFHVHYTIPPSTVAGTVLEFTSKIQSMLPTDEYALNNFDTLETGVFNSYDPNIKTVNPIGETSFGIIGSDQELEYTVHFQNTGNYMAHNIFVTDVLDVNLDISTLEITGASHPYEARINNRELRLDFKDIMLADSTSNEPASHGYFTYKIKPISGVMQGATIVNSANIYFDFNPPVITNQTLNTIESPMGIEPEETTILGKLYPNPAMDWVTLEIPESHMNNSTIDIQIMDLQGRTLQNLTLQTQPNLLLNISEFSSGIYLIKAGKTVYKFIKR